MKHPWIRIPDIATALGLILGSIGTIMIGLELNNAAIIIMAIISNIFFLLFFFINLYLFIRDYIALYPLFKKGFWKFQY